MLTNQNINYSAPTLEVLYSEATNVCLCASQDGSSVDQLTVDTTNALQWDI